jgi:hypothetical protein
VSKKGFKSRHDDVSDTISMLSEIDAYKPTEEVGTIGEVFSEGGGVWKMPGEDDDDFADNGSTVF